MLCEQVHKHLFSVEWLFLYTFWAMQSMEAGWQKWLVGWKHTGIAVDTRLLMSKGLTAWGRKLSSVSLCMFSRLHKPAGQCIIFYLFFGMGSDRCIIEGKQRNFKFPFFEWQLYSSGKKCWVEYLGDDNARFLVWESASRGSFLCVFMEHSSGCYILTRCLLQFSQVHQSRKLRLKISLPFSFLLFM